MADNDEDVIRAIRLQRLTEKIIALYKAESALTILIGQEQDPDLKRRYADQQAECFAERVLCEQRHAMLVAGAPLGQPGAGAEDQLLAAIDAVEAATAGGAAGEAALQAFHGLVVAFPGANA